MTPSKACKYLILSSEAFRAKPYLCPVGVPTIGYGATIYPGGQRVKLTDPPITEAQARELFEIEIARLTAEILHASARQLTQGQLDAMVSFTYNVGLPALLGSTLWRKLQAGDLVGAAAQFPRWVKGGKPKRTLPGLVTRRAAERKLFEGAAA